MYKLPDPPQLPDDKPRDPAGSFYASAYSSDECLDLANNSGPSIDQEIDLMRIHARRVSAMAEDPLLPTRDRLRATQLVTSLCVRISILSIKNNQIRTEQSRRAHISYLNSLVAAADAIAARAMQRKNLIENPIDVLSSEEDDSSESEVESPSSDFQYKPLW